ncbi:hypothetical protein PaG_05991 [Moesziomyces aphidis]|uniref:Uncharacterized protein n=1 Tax=Moesziomyces aphidis TaxID=84754 RepID=W3VEP5_MOEAP|nr:hypothetical protein PaG_05991 [Moesziomyces aphidis]
MRSSATAEVTVSSRARTDAVCCALLSNLIHPTVAIAIDPTASEAAQARRIPASCSEALPMAAMRRAMLRAAQLGDAVQPTLLALLWCTLLVFVKRASRAESPPAWPTRARSFIDAAYFASPGSNDIDMDKIWADLDWAAYRVMASLSTVTGLLLAFRSNSAIDRWSTARRKWSDVQATSRSLLRLLSASLLGGNDAVAPVSNRDFARNQASRAHVEATLATVPFFSISLMYEMRARSLELSSGRSSLVRSDLIDALPPAIIAATHRHRCSIPSANEADKAAEVEKSRLMQNTASPHALRPRARSARDTHGGVISTNLALTALVVLQQSLDALHRGSPSHRNGAGEGLLSSPVYAHSIGLVNALSGHMTDLERIRDTPIPLSVSRHFSRLLAIHTLLLPIVVAQRLYVQLPLCLAVTGVVTTMLYGVDSFAATLAQPFGLDQQDLPLEKYVADAQREWDEIRTACNVDATSLA